MEIKIYQVPEKDFRGFFSDDSQLQEVSADLWEKGEFVFVASLEVPDTVDSSDALNYAYEKTNSIDSAWYEADDITVAESASYGCRSTSVGDAISIDGEISIVASMGFVPLLETSPEIKTQITSSSSEEEVSNPLKR